MKRIIFVQAPMLSIGANNYALDGLVGMDFETTNWPYHPLCFGSKETPIDCRSSQEDVYISLQHFFDVVKHKGSDQAIEQVSRHMWNLTAEILSFPQEICKVIE